MNDLKKCKTCLEEKLIKLFEKNRNVCKECRKKSRTLRNKELRIERKNNIKNNNVNCIKCNRIFDTNLFSIRENGFYKTICKPCFNEKKYYKKYRDKKRNENLIEYILHNNNIHKKWYVKNKNHIQKYAKKNINVKHSSWKNQAIKKEISIEFDDFYAKELMKKPCIYCGYLDLDTITNGIDRLDSSINYTIKNSVSCCKICNFMKGTFDPITFIERCKKISKDLIFEEFTKLQNYQTYKNSSEKKKLQWNLTKTEFTNIITSNCYYCLVNNSGGIDRKNNKKGYIIENSVPCCANCNYMKKDLDIEIFISHCKKVSCFNENYKENFKNITPCKKYMKKRLLCT